MQTCLFFLLVIVQKLQQLKTVLGEDFQIFKHVCICPSVYRLIDLYSWVFLNHIYSLLNSEACVH